jgi:hypothetical protein
VLRGLAWPLAGRPAGGRRNQEATDAHCEHKITNLERDAVIGGCVPEGDAAPRYNSRGLEIDFALIGCSARGKRCSLLPLFTIFL